MPFASGRCRNNEAEAREDQAQSAGGVGVIISYVQLRLKGRSFTPALDMSIHMEFKVSYPKGCFRNLNRITSAGNRPPYLGERLRAPSWWRQSEVMAVFDKILLDKVTHCADRNLTFQHKKPSFIQRLTRSGTAKTQAQVTLGEALAKTMMRRRACELFLTQFEP